MENRVRSLSNECNFSSVKPIMMDLPYPPVRVERQNPAYANLLGMDLCGAVSELTATAQYINHENCIACERCAMARVVLGIAMAEMIHLQKLGELVVLLGGEVNYTVKGRDGRVLGTVKNIPPVLFGMDEMFFCEIENLHPMAQKHCVHRCETSCG